ncbi:MAG: glycosyltransferase [Fervidobacterium sp.]
MIDRSELLTNFRKVCELSSDKDLKNFIHSNINLSKYQEDILDISIHLRKGNLQKAKDKFEKLQENKYFLPYVLLKGTIEDLIGEEEKANESFVRAIFLSKEQSLRDAIAITFSKKYPEVLRAKGFVEDLKTHKLRILHGTIEIANQMYTYVSGLKKMGIYARSLNYVSTYLGYKNDYNIEINKVDNNVINQFINSFDIFHFHFGLSLHPQNADLPFLKSIGKTFLMQYWGSDVRALSKALKFNIYAKAKEQEELVLKRLDFVSKYVDHCVVEFTLSEYVKDYFKYIHFLPQAINLNMYHYSPKEPEEKIVIAHAPTNPEIKGTEIITSVVEKLKEKYPIEFVLIKGIPHSEAKKIYMKADLVIDQLHSEGYGLLAIECMALGKPVVVSVPDYFVKKYPPDLPVIRANPDNLLEVLENLIKKRNELPEIGKRGRQYVERYHDIEKVKYDLIQLYYDIMKEEGKFDRG